MATPSTATKKFTFDTHFDDGVAAASVAPSRSRKSYSADEIDAMRRAAREEGLQDGAVRQQAAVAGSIAQMAASIFQAIKTLDAEVESVRMEAAHLAFAAAKKIAGAALGHAPQEEIFDVLRQALHQAISEPRVLVRVSPALVATIEAETQRLAHEEGFDGRVVIAADASLRNADCRMEWKNGGIEHQTDTIEKSLADLIARRFPPLATLEKE